MRSQPSRLALVLAPCLTLICSPAMPAQDPPPSRPAEQAQPKPAKPTPLDLALDRDIAWIDDPETFVDGRRSKRAVTTKVDRGALLDQALERAKAEGKPVLWYVYRVVEEKSRGSQMYRAPVLDTYMRQVLFADPDVAGIVATRFVPLRMVCDEPMSKRFDLRPLEFIEPAVVFLDGDGQVLHVLERIRTFDALWFADLLRRVLDTRQVAGQKSARDLGTEQAIREGRWEQALAAVSRAEPRTPETEYLTATLLRRLRQPAEALAALRKVQADGALRAAKDAEEGLLLSLTGQLDAARPALERAWKSDAPRAAEAGYWLALGRLRQGDHGEARALYQAVAERFPDAPFGRMAQANVIEGDDERPLGASFLGFEHLGYLAPACYEGLPRDTQWIAGPLAAKDLAVQGVQFLLAQQRDDGGFTDSRYAYWPNADITTNVWVAITALAATALLEHRAVDPARVPSARVDAAIAKAERFILDPEHLNRGKNEDVYADAYRLVYLARKHELNGDAGARRAVVDQMNAIVAAAAKRQKDSGFWAHEYPNAFCTGAMLWSLLLARRAGADVGEELVSRGLNALASAREPSGAFVYGGAASGSGKTPLKDASARMPLCESVLLAFERSTPENLAFAFETFWQYLDRIERVRRNDFHSDGQLGGFFFFHGVFHASEAAKLLPADQRAAANVRLLKLLQQIPEMDGSFLDSHEIGRSYGTAMALLTLANVQ